MPLRARARRPRGPLRPAAALLLLAACAPPEAAELAPPPDPGQPPPQLTPTSEFDAALAVARPDATRLEEESAALAARAEALRDRAAALDAGTVIDPPAAERLTEASERGQ